MNGFKVGDEVTKIAPQIITKINDFGHLTINNENHVVSSPENFKLVPIKKEPKRKINYEWI